jgi:hypothetical protein
MDGWVKAVRLAGADGDLIPIDRLEVSCVHAPLTIAPELRTLRDDEVRRPLARADSRLTQWRLSPREDPAVRNASTVMPRLA